jgi:hypothetical protein
MICTGAYPNKGLIPDLKVANGKFQYRYFLGLNAEKYHSHPGEAAKLVGKFQQLR